MTEIVVTSDFGVVFLTTADLIVGGATVVHANLNTAVISSTTYMVGIDGVLVGDAEYTFVVQGENAVGLGAESSPSSIMLTGSANVPLAPASLTATEHSSGKVKLEWSQTNWDDHGAPIVGWRIEYKLAADSTWLIVTDSTYNTFFSSDIIVSGLLASSSYHFRVAGWNRVGLGAYSSSTATLALATAATLAPAPTTRPSVVVTGSDTVTLTWSRATDVISSSQEYTANPTIVNGAALTGYRIEARRHDTEVQTLRLYGGQTTTKEWDYTMTSATPTASVNAIVTQNEWTLGIAPQTITENAGVVVTQGGSTGTLSTACQNEWTLVIAPSSITENAGVTVTQGSSTGTLKVGLVNEWTMTITGTLKCFSSLRNLYHCVTYTRL